MITSMGRRDVMRLEANEIKVIISGAFFVCPRCGSLKPGSEFGLRFMDKRYVRNQAQCKMCRAIKK